MVDPAEVMEIGRARTFVTTLVRGKERLAELGPWPSVQLVQRPDLGHDVGQRDAVREAMCLDPAGAVERRAPIVDLFGDVCGSVPERESASADDASEVCFFARRLDLRGV